MSTSSHGGWPVRLIWSSVLATAVVVLSALFFLLFVSGRPSSAMNAASYVIGAPLLPGLGFVSLFWGSWQAFHQGQIAFVPLFSIIVDSAITFAIREFVHPARSEKPDSHITLNLK